MKIARYYLENRIPPAIGESRGGEVFNEEKNFINTLQPSQDLFIPNLSNIYKQMLQGLLFGPQGYKKEFLVNLRIYCTSVE